uniref:Dipeptidylpeptidase IV N-terminal domain-containing protein n=1 Tax=Romanomermis culicivorax TaxID=13658 RepID=A0A915KD68_ROMCU
MFETNNDDVENGGAEKELVAGGPSQRNWKGVGIACLVILFICSLIAAAVFLLTPNKDLKINGTKFNLSDLLLPKVSLFDAQATWLSAHVLSFRDENRTVWKLKFSTHDDVQNSTVKYTTEKLLDVELTSKYYKWILSPDAKYAAMFSLKQKHTRRSSSKVVHIFETQTSSHKILNGGRPIMLFKWAPISYPAALAFVDENNNLWYQKDAFDPDSLIQITHTGSEDIFNGISDWLYEEEIFESPVGLFFSKTGTKLAYVTINDTRVRKISFDIYSDSDNYPETQSIPYPKVGELIPTITLNVHFLNQSLVIDNYHRKRATDLPIDKTIILKPPKDVEQLGEYYLINGNWISNSKKDAEIFVAVWSNRVQNVSYFSTCQVPNRFKGDTIQCELDYTHHYLNNWITPSLLRMEFSTDEKYFIILPQKMSDGYNYAHLASINYSSNSRVIPRGITTGLWEVTSIVGLNSQKETLYFIAAYPTPNARHLMSVSLTGKLPTVSQCLTCHMPKNQCNSFGAEFSPNADYFVLSCHGPGVPKTFLMSTKNETS